MHVTRNNIVQSNYVFFRCQLTLLAMAFSLSSPNWEDATDATIRHSWTSCAVSWGAEPGPYYLRHVYGNPAFYLRLQLLRPLLECAVICGEVIGYSAFSSLIIQGMWEGSGRQGTRWRSWRYSRLSGFKPGQSHVRKSSKCSVLFQKARIFMNTAMRISHLAPDILVASIMFFHREGCWFWSPKMGDNFSVWRQRKLEFDTVFLFNLPPYIQF